jgi:hypothetical protein
VIALGWALRRWGFLSGEVVGGISKVAYWVALPALLFSGVADAFTSSSGLGSTFVIVLVGVTACLLAGYAAARAMRLTGRQTGALVHAAFRGNLGFIGLAVVFNAFPADGSPARTMAMLTLAPIVPLHNILAVVVLLAGRHKLGRAAVGNMLKQVAINPLLLSCVAGVLWSMLHVAMPSFVSGTLEIVGQIALPAALLAIGARLAEVRLAGNILPALVAAMLKTGFAPAVGYLVAVAIGAGPTETAVGLLLLACPTAIVSFILTDQLDGDTALASGAVVVSTFMSIASLSVVLALVA